MPLSEHGGGMGLVSSLLEARRKRKRGECRGVGALEPGGLGGVPVLLSLSVGT